MTLFEEIVHSISLLREFSDDNAIKDAINKMLRVRMVYDDDGRKTSKGKNERIIFPVAFGLSRAGNQVVRALQSFGSTKRGILKWKLFRVDRIISWSNEKRTFKAEEYRLVGLNKDGDLGMTEIYAISPLCKEIGTTNDVIAKPMLKKDINAPGKKENVSASDIMSGSNKGSVESNARPIDKLGSSDIFSKDGDVYVKEPSPIMKKDVK